MITESKQTAVMEEELVHSKAAQILRALAADTCTFTKIFALVIFAEFSTFFANANAKQDHVPDVVRATLDSVKSAEADVGTFVNRLRYFFGETVFYFSQRV